MTLVPGASLFVATLSPVERHRAVAMSLHALASDTTLGGTSAAIDTVTENR